ncbi:MAG TPA: nuclear transport factor 2 family protein [Solirubrobacteraceae bacterium]|jgi:ketosteroid isomerase-like protein
MYSWLVGLIVRRGFRRLNAGDLSALGMFAPDARFVFPGRHSFAADSRDPNEIRAWFERFIALRPHFEIADVIASGPPWNMRVGVCFADHFSLPDGSKYENQGMQYVRLRWGRVQLDRLFLDTQRVADADRVLSGG